MWERHKWTCCLYYTSWPSIIFNKGLVWIALWFLLQSTIGKLLPLSQPYVVKDELAFEDYYYGFCLDSPSKI